MKDIVWNASEGTYVCPGCGKQIPKSKWFKHKCYKPKIMCKY